MAINAVGFFCEDIRQEKSGQVTLVGVLPDNVSVAPPPEPKPGPNAKPQAQIPKLGVYVRVNVGLEDDPGSMKVSLIFPSGEESLFGMIDAEIIATAKKQAIDNDLPFAGAVSYGILAGLRTSPGKLLVVLDANSERHTCAVLNIVPG